MQGLIHGVYEANSANSATSTEQSNCLLKKLILAHALKTSLALMEAEQLLPCSQEPAAWLCPELEQWSTQLDTPSFLSDPLSSPVPRNSLPVTLVN